MEYACNVHMQLRMCLQAFKILGLLPPHAIHGLLFPIVMAELLDHWYLVPRWLALEAIHHLAHRDRILLRSRFQSTF